MESNPGRSPLRPLLTLLGVLASVAVVAVASRASTSSGEAGGRRPSETVVDVLFTAYLLLLAAGAVFFVYLLVLQRGLKRKAGIAGTSPLSLLVIFAILLFGLFAARRLGELRRPPPPEETLVPGGGPPPATTQAPEPTAADPGFAWPMALAFVALVLAASLAFWWAGVRRRRAYAPHEQAALGEELAEVLERTLDDLRAERDPRRAVIAAYARLERVLAAHGLPRRAADAPAEYLRRVLTDLAVTPDAARRLTLLFERAKFSHHEVGPAMKDEAVAALEAIQNDLRVAEALREQERERAARLAIERARGAA